MTWRVPAPTPSILVVDDSQPILLLLQEVLADAGFTVHVALDGQAALALAHAAPPDLILTDLMMPHLDGHALRARLQADPQTAHIPIVGMSAARPVHRADGFAGFIAKPFDLDVLLAELRRHLP